jgi:proline dehydrogenase
MEWLKHMSNYLALHQEIEQHLSDQITNDWLEESKTRDHLTSGEVIGYEASQVFADLSDYLKSLEAYEEKLVRGEIQW